MKTYVHLHMCDQASERSEVVAPDGRSSERDRYVTVRFATVTVFLTPEQADALTKDLAACCAQMKEAA